MENPEELVSLFSLSNTPACIYLTKVLKPACNFCTLDHACMLSNPACKNCLYIYDNLDDNYVIPDE